MELEDAMEVTVDFRQKSPLMKWTGSIDILKHVTEGDLGNMFNDGVLFFHLLRELFEEDIQDADELAEKILPSENYREMLLNWKIINDNILEKLKIGKSGWFIEYLAKGNVEYIENILNSVREIAPVKHPKKEVKPDVMTELPLSQSSNWWNSETNYFNDILYKAKVAIRRRSRSRSREPSPFPRLKLARERVIWGIPKYTEPAQRRSSSHRRSSTSFHYPSPITSPMKRNYRYYNRTHEQTRRRRDSSFYYDDRYDDRKPFRAPSSVQTYCFMERQIRKRRNTKLQALKMRLGKRSYEDVKVSDDVNGRFEQLLKKYKATPMFSRNNKFESPGYRRYLYRYYDQFPRDCNYCTPLIEEENDLELEEGELME